MSLAYLAAFTLLAGCAYSAPPSGLNRSSPAASTDLTHPPNPDTATAQTCPSSSGWGHVAQAYDRVGRQANASRHAPSGLALDDPEAAAAFPGFAVIAVDHADAHVSGAPYDNRAFHADASAGASGWVLTLHAVIVGNASQAAAAFDATAPWLTLNGSALERARTAFVGPAPTNGTAPANGPAVRRHGAALGGPFALDRLTASLRANGTPTYVHDVLDNRVTWTNWTLHVDVPWVRAEGTWHGHTWSARVDSADWVRLSLRPGLAPGEGDPVPGILGTDGTLPLGCA